MSDAAAVEEADPVEAPGAELAVVDQASASLSLIPGREELLGIMQMANALSRAGIVPKALQHEPANVFLVLLTARDLKVAPTTAIREFHVIDGKVTVSPKARLAMARQERVANIWPAPGNDAEHATWCGYRYDDPNQTVWESTFTMDDARRVPMAKWVNGKRMNSTLAEKDNWLAYPKRMLSWRALGYLLDDMCPEIGTGLYSPDEMGAVTDEDGVPVTLDTVDMPAGFASDRPPDAPAPEPLDVVRTEALKGRIAKLPEGARQELAAGWKERGIPPLGTLLANQEPLVAALVSSLESRARTGEWEGPIKPEIVDEQDDGRPSDDGPIPADEVRFDGANADQEAML